VALQTSTASNPITIAAYSVVRADLNTPTTATAVGSAGFAPGPVAPQEIVSIFGPGIASQDAVASLPLPTVLGGVSVQITDSAGNTQPAQLFVLSPGQANILIPSGLAAGPASLAVLHGSFAALTGSLTIAATAPGLFSANADGAGVAAANAFTISASNQTIPQSVFTCNPPAARSCLGVKLSPGAATDTLYVSLFGTGIRGASSVSCFVAGQSVPCFIQEPRRSMPASTRSISQSLSL
jgi:uncharacterized protein (TIGR03437 family)